MSLRTFRTAKTAYGLLGQIVKLIEQDPRRMRMERWHSRVKYLPENERPECGTVGCIGGWVDTLTRRSAYRNAHKTLGFCRVGTYGDPNWMADDKAMDQLMFGKLCNDPQQGTRGHMRKVVRSIRKFQRQYRQRLLKTRVVYGRQEFTS